MTNTKIDLTEEILVKIKAHMTPVTTDHASSRSLGSSGETQIYRYTGQDPSVIKYLEYKGNYFATKTLHGKLKGKKAWDSFRREADALSLSGKGGQLEDGLLFMQACVIEDDKSDKAESYTLDKLFEKFHALDQGHSSLDNSCLRSEYKRYKRDPINYLCGLFNDVVSEQDKLHAQDLHQHDLKPNNIMLSAPAKQSGRAKIIDFGRAASGPLATSALPDQEKLDNPYYLNFRALYGEPPVLDRRTEIYGRKATLIELLGGSIIPGFAHKLAENDKASFYKKYRLDRLDDSTSLSVYLHKLVIAMKDVALSSEQCMLLAALKSYLTTMPTDEAMASDSQHFQMVIDNYVVNRILYHELDHENKTDESDLELKETLLQMLRGDNTRLKKLTEQALQLAAPKVGETLMALEEFKSDPNRYASCEILEKEIAADIAKKQDIKSLESLIESENAKGKFRRVLNQSNVEQGSNGFIALYEYSGDNPSVKAFLKCDSSGQFAFKVRNESSSSVNGYGNVPGDELTVAENKTPFEIFSSQYVFENDVDIHGALGSGVTTSIMGVRGIMMPYAKHGDIYGLIRRLEANVALNQHPKLQAEYNAHKSLCLMRLMTGMVGQQDGLHRRGIVHVDSRASNYLVMDDTLDVMAADFGLAKTESGSLEHRLHKLPLRYLSYDAIKSPQTFGVRLDVYQRRLCLMEILGASLGPEQWWFNLTDGHESDVTNVQMKQMIDAGRDDRSLQCYLDNMASRVIKKGDLGSILMLHAFFDYFAKMPERGNEYKDVAAYQSALDQYFRHLIVVDELSGNKQLDAIEQQYNKMLKTLHLQSHPSKFAALQEAALNSALQFSDLTSYEQYVTESLQSAYNSNHLSVGIIKRYGATSIRAKEKPPLSEFPGYGHLPEVYQADAKPLEMHVALIHRLLSGNVANDAEVKKIESILGLWDFNRSDVALNAFSNLDDDASAKLKLIIDAWALLPRQMQSSLQLYDRCALFARMLSNDTVEFNELTERIKLVHDIKSRFKLDLSYQLMHVSDWDYHDQKDVLRILEFANNVPELRSPLVVKAMLNQLKVSSVEDVCEHARICILLQQHVATSIKHEPNLTATFSFDNLFAQDHNITKSLWQKVHGEGPYFNLLRARHLDKCFEVKHQFQKLEQLCLENGINLNRNKMDFLVTDKFTLPGLYQADPKHVSLLNKSLAEYIKTMEKAPDMLKSHFAIKLHEVINIAGYVDCINLRKLEPDPGLFAKLLSDTKQKNFSAFYAAIEERLELLTIDDVSLPDFKKINHDLISYSVYHALHNIDDRLVLEIIDNDNFKIDNFRLDDGVRAMLSETYPGIQFIQQGDSIIFNIGQLDNDKHHPTSPSDWSTLLLSAGDETFSFEPNTLQMLYSDYIRLGYSSNPDDASVALFKFDLKAMHGDTFLNNVSPVIFKSLVDTFNEISDKGIHAYYEKHPPNKPSDSHKPAP